MAVFCECGAGPRRKGEPSETQQAAVVFNWHSEETGGFLGGPQSSPKKNFGMSDISVF